MAAPLHMAKEDTIPRGLFFAVAQPHTRPRVLPKRRELPFFAHTQLLAVAQPGTTLLTGYFDERRSFSRISNL